VVDAAGAPRRPGAGEADGPSLSVRDLSVGSEDGVVVVVDEVAFEVAAGEVLALVDDDHDSVLGSDREIAD